TNFSLGPEYTVLGTEAFLRFTAISRDIRGRSRGRRSLSTKGTWLTGARSGTSGTADPAWLTGGLLLRAVVALSARFLAHQGAVRPAGSCLFLRAHQGQRGQALGRALGEEVGERRERGHGGDVVQDEGEWWVEPTGG
ncbi:hypothetical protein GA0115260_106244, partial [Streptomyces sp. MnatMP-M27]